ncbi:MAG: hypothetical protein DMG67_18675 [Acidobacteria bacterium]|nr:MAG: hypothetical protein DMG67_18675 [Acidobacteriota bacterium]
MHPEEYRKLAARDQVHWFYRGKRAIALRWIQSYAKLHARDLLLDCGFGVGTWLVEMAGRCRVVGIDDHPDSIAIGSAQVMAKGGAVLCAEVNRIPLADGTVAVVTLMDVLEHLDEDIAALHEAVRVARSGGIILVIVPAFPSLWSDWDVSLHHRRRYERATLLAKLNQTNADILRCTFINSLAFPAIAAIRWLRNVLPSPGIRQRAEDKVPFEILNRALYHAFVQPALWPWFQPPFGVSLLAILRKRD